MINSATGKDLKVVAVLPARMGSSRYPGKPLTPIFGIPMIEHVRRRVEAMRFIDEVYVATCDKEIRDVVEAAGGRVIMTKDSHERATERIEEAAHQFTADIVINVQGDEPMVLAEPLRELLSPFAVRNGVDCTCLIYPIREITELGSDNIVKAVLSQSGRVLYFSRSPIPGRDVRPKTRYYKQSGLMAFSKECLHRFVQMSMTPLEIQESVDLNRLLENDLQVHGVFSEQETKGIDVPAQVSEVEAAIMADTGQKLLFEQLVKNAGR